MNDFFSKHGEKISYLVVGAWNTLFGYGLFAGLYFLFSARLHYLVLLVISYLFSVTNAFFCYKIFVFKTRGNHLREYARFHLVYGLTLIANLIFLPLLVEVTGLHPVAGQGVFMVVTVVCSYLGHRYFSFA